MNGIDRPAAPNSRLQAFPARGCAIVSAPGHGVPRPATTGVAMNAPHEAKPLTDAARQALLDGLAAILPDAALLTRPEDTVPYECDGLAAYRQLPLAVALPDTEDQAGHPAPVPPARRGGGAARRRHQPVRRRHAGRRRPGAAAGQFKRIVCVDARARAPPWSSPACATWPSPEAAAPHQLYYAPDPPRRSPAPSAATSARTRAACTA